MDLWFATNFLGELLLLERADGLNGRAALPSFHVFWACAATVVWRELGRWWSRCSAVWLVLAIISCWTTGMHAIADLVAGVGLYIVARFSSSIWRWAIAVCEAIANSWREWRAGPIRLISHGFYAGAGAAATYLVASLLTGPEHLWSLVLMAIVSLVGAALIGQLLVGGSTLRRPFGYFGSVVGVGLTAVGMAVSGAEIWALCAAIAAAAPLGQAVGRCRCLVQGCCHGAPAESGIVYRQSTSRVVYLSNLGGRPLHPTPLYSIVANIVIGLLLMKMWAIGAAAGLVVGGYLILSGFARFVEESYRGESQTQVVCGLRIYQGFAVLSVAAGMAVSSLPSPALEPALETSFEVVGGAIAIALVHLIAMGVDFPGSNRRFARLTN